MLGGNRTKVAVTVALVALGGAAASASASSVGSSALESGVLTDINQVRTSHHLAPLRLSVGLGAAAREHSQQMAADGYFAHESHDGSAFWRRVQRFYAQGRFGYWSVGENLLWSSPDVDAAGALRMWRALSTAPTCSTPAGARSASRPSTSLVHPACTTAST